MFGIMLLAVAVYLIDRIAPDAIVLALWAALALLSAVLLIRATLVHRRLDQERTGHRQWLTKASMALGVGAAVYSVALAVGALTGANNPLRPLDVVLGTHQASLQFRRVKSVAELDQVIAAANRAGRIVMLDFYADWCVSCIEMERDTFTAPSVRQALQDAVLVQADVTLYDDEDQALLERFGLHGPPAIIFFGLDGQERRSYRVIGFMAADDFVPHVIQAGGA
jgi:thiol:disulfide interchange protein DsbD